MKNISAKYIWGLALLASLGLSSLAMAGKTANNNCGSACTNQYKQNWKACGGDCALLSCQQAVLTYYACISTCSGATKPNGLCGIPNPY